MSDSLDPWFQNELRLFCPDMYIPPKSAEADDPWFEEMENMEEREEDDESTKMSLEGTSQYRLSINDDGTHPGPATMMLAS